MLLVRAQGQPAKVAEVSTSSGSSSTRAVSFGTCRSAENSSRYRSRREVSENQPLIFCVPCPCLVLVRVASHLRVHVHAHVHVHVHVHVPAHVRVRVLVPYSLSVPCLILSPLALARVPCSCFVRVSCPLSVSCVHIPVDVHVPDLVLVLVDAKLTIGSSKIDHLTSMIFVCRYMFFPSYIVAMHHMHMSWTDKQLMWQMYTIARIEGYLDRDVDEIVGSIVPVLVSDRSRVLGLLLPRETEMPINLPHAHKMIEESAQGLGICLEPVVTAVMTIQAHFRECQKRRSIAVKEKAIFASSSSIAADAVSQMVEFMQVEQDCEKHDEIVEYESVKEKAIFASSSSIGSGQTQGKFRTEKGGWRFAQVAVSGSFRANAFFDWPVDPASHLAVLRSDKLLPLLQELVGDDVQVRQFLHLSVFNADNEIKATTCQDRLGTYVRKEKSKRKGRGCLTQCTSMGGRTVPADPSSSSSGSESYTRWHRDYGRAATELHEHGPPMHAVRNVFLCAILY
eukprot:COSAG06_NODE_728_length_12746_cov_13.586068_1_plen_509_part_00